MSNKTLPTWAYVVEDMLQRNKDGKKKYGRQLDVNCPDDMLQHAYEEALDLAVYLKNRMLQEKASKSYRGIKQEIA